MTAPLVRATVRVEFVLEFHAGPWGMDCDMAQVTKQAADGARSAAEAVLNAAREAPYQQSKTRLLRITKIGPASIHMPEEDGAA